MWHVVCNDVNWVDFQLFLVRSQTDTLTPDPSFGHNLWFRCLNEQYEPILYIYVPRSFQWYKQPHKPLSFDPWNRTLKFQDSTRTPSPKVGVALGVWMFIPSHSLTLSYIPRSMWCDSWASSWFAPLRPLCVNSRASSWPAPLWPLCVDSRASSWPATLQPLCIGRKPKTRVAIV
jgi:hypothetical protein